MTVLTTLLAFCTAMTFSPGPNTALSTALAANYGLRRAWPFCLAVATGWALLMVACGLGVGALVADAPALRWVVKLAGVAYLLLLAYRLGSRTSPALADAKRLMSFRRGVVLQLVNIKAWMLTLTLTAGWVTNVAEPPGRRLALVCAVLVLFAVASNLSYAMVGSVLGGWLARDSRLRQFNRALAAILVLTAIWMLTV